MVWGLFGHCSWLKPWRLSTCDIDSNLQWFHWGRKAARRINVFTRNFDISWVCLSAGSISPINLRSLLYWATFPFVKVTTGLLYQHLHGGEWRIKTDTLHWYELIDTLLSKDVRMNTFFHFIKAENGNQSIKSQIGRSNLSCLTKVDAWTKDPLQNFPWAVCVNLVHITGYAKQMGMLTNCQQIQPRIDVYSCLSDSLMDHLFLFVTKQQSLINFPYLGPLFLLWIVSVFLVTEDSFFNLYIFWN